MRAGAKHSDVVAGTPAGPNRLPVRFGGPNRDQVLARCAAPEDREGIERMLDEQDTTDTTSTESAAAPPQEAAPRRRRAAKRPAGPPPEAEPVAFSAPAPQVPPPAADNDEAPKTAKPPARRSRRKVAVDFEAPVAGSPADTGEDSSSAAAGALAVPLFQPPPETPVRRRTRKPADDATGDESGDDAGATESTADAAEGKPVARRRRRGRAGGADTSDSAQTDDSGDQASEDQPAGGEARGGRGRSRSARSGNAKSGDDNDNAKDSDNDADNGADPDDDGDGNVRRRRRRRRGGGGGGGGGDAGGQARDEVTALKGSTRIEAKRQRRKEGRESGRRRAPLVSEAEFLARREAVKRTMLVRQQGTLTQIVVLEDGVLVEHYVNQATASSLVGNVYLGRVQNVLPSMEAAFVDIGRGRNAVLYAGEVNWDAAGLEGQPKRIEQALSSGDKVMVQVTKDPIGHKGARLTSQVSLPGRFIVYVPDGSMTGISRKLPEKERTRLRGILREALPDGAGVIVRTAAEGASEEDLKRDVEHLTGAWEQLSVKAEKVNAPALLHSEPDLALRVVRDIFNSDFESLVVSGDEIGTTLIDYVADNAPGLSERVSRWTDSQDVFAHFRVDEQLAKALDRKVYLPSGGSLVIDRTEAMTVVDVNTGRFTGQGGNLEETVTRNNLEAAEEIVRQIRLRDAGGIIVIDFIDMVLESNRDLVLRRLVECLGRDRTKHQVAEVTSLGLVQMTRKRIGQGLLETFSEPCDCCNGRGVKVHSEPVEGKSGGGGGGGGGRERKPRSVRPPGAHDPVEAAAARARQEADEAGDAEPIDAEPADGASTADEPAVAEAAVAEPGAPETVAAEDTATGEAQSSDDATDANDAENANDGDNGDDAGLTEGTTTP